MVAMIQLGYWKYSTGQWFYYSYKGERFNFKRPHVVEGLFSYQKGWFIYTPIAFLAILGLLYMWYKKSKLAPGILFFYALTIYVVFCWQEWWYGGGFGARALVETLPFLAISLAYMADGVFKREKGMALKAAFSIVTGFLVLLNLFQTFQYSKGTIHYVKMNRTYYWKVFGKIKPTAEEYKTMMTDDECNKEKEDCFGDK